MTFKEDAEQGVITWQHMQADCFQLANHCQDQGNLQGAIWAQHKQRHAFLMAEAIREMWLDPSSLLCFS